MTMAQLRFFRHKEIADCLSVASLVYDRTDEARMRRIVRDMVQGLDARAARHLAHESRDLGLQLSDLIRGGGKRHPDPLEVLKISRVVVLDTETTGVDPNQDEVIERPFGSSMESLPNDLLIVSMLYSRTPSRSVRQKPSIIFRIGTSGTRRATGSRIQCLVVLYWRRPHRWS